MPGVFVMVAFLSWSHQVKYSKWTKESETLVDLSDDAELRASHEAIASGGAEEDGSLNGNAEYERERIRWTRYYHAGRVFVRGRWN